MELLTWIWLAEAFSYGSIQPYQLLSIEPDIETIYQKRAERDAFPFLSVAEYKRLSAHRREEYLPLLQRCKEKKIKLITYSDELYPSRLRQMDSPPMVLYYWGDLSSLSRPLCISIVGSRNCSSYSQRVALTLARELALRGVTVISGCALGIDSCAHQGVLEENRPTVSVLGTPLDVFYPASNTEMKREILRKGGALISEYPPGTKTHPALFPVRNRILAGLADGVVVVEASETSGSLITARHAADQGRELFCVPPHDLFQNRYDGVKDCIRQGAHVLFSYRDILDVFSSLYHPDPVAEQIESMNFSATPEERKILQLLSNGPVGIEELVLKTGYPVSRLMSMMTQLECSGQVVDCGGQRYSKR